MIMKKKYLPLIVLIVGFSACAIPGKKPVYTPTAVQPPRPQVTVNSAVPTLPQKVLQPQYLDISDQEPEQVIIEENLGGGFPSIAYINDRIFEYGNKLSRWKELDAQSASAPLNDGDANEMVRCFRRLQNVLNGYTNVRSKLMQAQQVITSEHVTAEEYFQLQENDVSFLEDSCGRMLADTEKDRLGWQQREEKADLAQLETLIDRYAGNKEFEEVIQVWQQIPESQVARVHLRTKIQYGNALMYLHQEEKAAAIYQQVVDQMTDSNEQATDLLSLRKRLADLYTASGNYRDASSQYKKISDDYVNIGRLEEWSKLQLSILDRATEGSPELTEYSAMLRNYLGYIPEKDGYKVIWQTEKFLTDYPYSPVASNVDFIKTQLTLAADNWFNGFMTQVDQLVGEKKFTEALELLETIPQDIIGPEKQLGIKSKNEELLLAEAVEKETEKMARIQELQHQWNNGMLLAKERRYDEAIVIFTNLLDSEFATKAEEKIAEVSLEAAKADRRTAANLFQRFTKTTDLEGRIKLLLECRNLLKSILVKYPGVEITGKVTGNIERVEQELNAIDPMILVRADQPESAVVPLDGPDTVFAPPSPASTMEQPADGLPPSEPSE